MAAMLFASFTMTQCQRRRVEDIFFVPSARECIYTSVEWKRSTSTECEWIKWERKGEEEMKSESDSGRQASCDILSIILWFGFVLVVLGKVFTCVCTMWPLCAAWARCERTWRCAPYTRVAHTHPPLFTRCTHYYCMPLHHVSKVNRKKEIKIYRELQLDLHRVLAIHSNVCTPKKALDANTIKHGQHFFAYSLVPCVFYRLMS